MQVHVVLYEPEIPQNTGNIIRTCVATGCRLHLIEPLGFDRVAWDRTPSGVAMGGWGFMLRLEDQVETASNRLLAEAGFRA